MLRSEFMQALVYQHLLEILERAAAEHPERPALLYGPERVSHGELARRAGRLERALRALGLGPGDRVAIVLRKSIEAVVAMAATLRAGGVYVPIDRFQPKSRIGQILADCGCSIIITDRAFLDAGEGGEALEMPRSVLVVDDGDEDLPDLDGAPAPRLERSPDDLAFMLYTSGATGRPNGVPISHRNLLTFLNWCLQEFDLGPEDVFASNANFNFDLSTFDIYAALAVGASIRILSEEDVKKSFTMAQAIEADRITVWYSVPSTLRLLLMSGALEKHDCSSLRYVLFAGEVFPTKYLRMLRERWPHVQLYNLYGPTETNVCAYYRVDSIPEDQSVTIPIGRPLPGVQASIVDEQGRAVASRETGELVIEGACVTPGYWNLEGHRNEYNHRRGIHATGDLVSLENGELIFHGRIDDMVKVKGFRVELGEVENALTLHPDIEHAAAAVTEVDDQNVLHACYEAAEPLSLLAIKRHCAGLLPSYMIPHRAYHFRSFPTTPNGKVDRQALRRIIGGDKPTPS